MPFIFYMTPSFVGWAIPVSVQSYLRQIFRRWLANWFKLGSAQPNLQQQKNGFFVMDLKFIVIKFQIFFWYDDGCLAKGHTGSLCVWSGGFTKLNITILKTVTFLDFSNIEEFNRRCNFGWYRLNFPDSKPTHCTHQNLCITLTPILGFLLNFSTSWKRYVKMQWSKIFFF